PVPKQGGPARLSGLMLAQDTGGAIVGNHVDLFCGSGVYAEHVAGRMKNPGALHILVSNRALAELPLPAANGTGAGGNDAKNGAGAKNANGGGNGGGTGVKNGVQPQ
ncbi:MAG: hypothetical protein C0405_06825, partial [Desulfovibrio sp.]|nr:hypothetical protein [Desulfovibrio sp.]